MYLNLTMTRLHFHLMPPLCKWFLSSFLMQGQYNKDGRFCKRSLAFDKTHYAKNGHIDWGASVQKALDLHM